MEKITKTYVEKIYRGLLFSESSIKEVADRNPMLRCKVSAFTTKNML